MPKRWLGLVLVMLSLAIPRIASAAATMIPSTIAVGDVAIGTSGMETGELAGTPPDHMEVMIVVPATAACSRFAITPLTPNLLTPQTITVTFTPVARGLVTCTVSIMNGAAVAGTFTVTGNGTAPVLEITSSVPVDFGSVRVNNAAVQISLRNITVRNTGDIDLSITALALSGAHPGDYTIISPSQGSLPVTVAPSTDLTVTVEFDPSAPGTRTASLDVTSNDPIDATESASLTGIGTSALIAVTDVAFGTVNVGSTSNLTTTISNAASASVGTLTVTSATISGGSWFSFTAGTGCTAGTTSCTLTGITAPGNKTVGVRCSPPAGAMGMQTGTVTFASDSDAGGDDVAALACTAGRADVSVDMASLAFGNVIVGATGSLSVMISNTGNLPLTYSITETGTHTNQFAVTTGCISSCTLAAMTTTTIMVTFAPTSIGAKTAGLRITSNDPDNATLDIPMTGTGIAGHADVTPASLAFSTVEVGATSASQLVTVTNSGLANLVIAGASFSTLGSDYVATMGVLDTQITLGPGMSTTWMIACRPTTHGNRNGNFRIVSNSDGIAGTQSNVALTCTGQQGLLAISPSSHDFGGVPAGETRTQNFTLTNGGNVAVNNITALLSSTTVGYSITAPTLPITTLAAGASVTVTVRFAPASGADGGPVTLTLSGAWGTARTAMTTLAIDGDGLTAGFDVTPATIAFGELRWDTTPTRTFCIVNTSQAAVSIMSMVVTPAAGTMTGEFTLPTIHRRACGATTTNVVTLPQSLTMGQTLEVIVRADPADRTGAMAATVTVMSNLAVMPTRTVALTGTSTTAMLTTAPGLTVDFGDVDLHLGPQERTITITNTGTAALNLGAFTRTANPQFTLTLPAATVLQPAETLMVPVTYTPTSEAAPNQSEQVQLSHTIAGVLNGPTMQMITVRGRGVDRHLALAPVPAFPDTFRNPGTAAPVRPVTVTNTGEATLQITAVMITNDDVWQVDTSPVDIPGGGTHEFQVTFAPKIAGKAPVGQLALMNDDDQNPMAIVQLEGNGLDRSVAMGDPVIDLGYTAIGIPVRLENALSITSMDPATGFVIRAVELEDDSVFAIEGAPADVALAPSASLQFAVTFTPDAEGEFETRALLFLDEDPLAQAEVTLRGRAVFVDVSGGGGCSTGTGGGAGAAGMLLGLLGLLARGRRRRGAAVLAGVCCLAVPATSHAQAAQVDLDLAAFSPTPSTTGTHFQLQPATVGASGSWMTSAVMSYATNPLVLRFADSEHLSITRRAAMELGLAYAFLDRFEAGLRLPLYNQDGEGEMVGVASPSGTARGDLVAHVRAQLVRATSGAGELAAAASVHVTIPTASEQAFAGVDKPSGRVLGLLAFTPAAIRSRLTLTANAGGVVRSKSSFSNIEQGSGLAWGLGASFRVLDALWATAEVFGDVLPGGRREGPMEAATALITGEALLGASYRPGRVAVGLAVGRGVIAGIGTPDVRGVFSLAFTPGRSTPTPIYPPPPPKIDGDQDGDGVRDSVDACPNEPEDLDMFEDQDGCPDPDNDGDGIIDAHDKCPLDPEDKDGFEDDDGCPDKDNDGDGIADAQDKCPMVPEDKDGFQDLDGCPDLDNDGDGIEDGADKCPNEPETINGVEDEDGCPDRGDSLVVLTPSGLETLDPVQFTGTKISTKSANVLGQVAATLRARAEIVRLKVVVHVNPGKDPARDLELTEKRAQAVRDWLVEWGIAASRLSAQGFGGKRPLVPKGQKNATLVNERIELIILERK